MKPDRYLIAAVVFLAVGLYLTFGYCNGTVGINAGWPLSATVLNICVTTKGPGAVGGPALTLLGILLLLWAVICAIVSQLRLPFSGPKKAETPKEQEQKAFPPKD